MRHIFGSSQVEREVIAGLRDNLRVWPRLEASKHASQADEQFYRAAITNDHLAELSGVTGFEYATWGSVLGKIHIGICLDDELGLHQYASIGLRWAEDLNDWHNKGPRSKNHQGGAYIDATRQTKDATGKARNIRHVVGKLWCPQLVVTIRPLSLYLRWRTQDRFLTNKGNKRGFNARAIMETREWQNSSFQIIPLCVHVRILRRSELRYDGSLRSARHQRSKGLVIRDDVANPSRFRYDDARLADNPAVAKMVAEDWSNVHGREQYLRDLHRTFVDLKGYEEW